MSEENKHRATAAAILPLVGGAANVTSVAHCMTRLRLGLRDRSLVQEEALKALPAVMGVVEDDTYQIVLGPGTVARVTPEFEARRYDTWFFVDEVAEFEASTMFEGESGFGDVTATRTRKWEREPG